jgi:hypothetical protein
MHSIGLRGQAPEIEQKRAALTYLHEAWVEARTDGIDGDCLAQAGYAEGLARRIREGEFSLHPATHQTRQ